MLGGAQPGMLTQIVTRDIAYHMTSVEEKKKKRTKEDEGILSLLQHLSSEMFTCNEA